jgi:DtxR family transcriptional regulator, Mn-dependent transcriptional regulator
VSEHRSEAIEMYLRTVLELEEEGIPALRARLSERLGLSAPAVSEGVNRLEVLGLARLAPDRTVTLTTEGRGHAEHVLRKHRLAERLLVDVLGLEREHVHEEACRWEHVISDRVEQKLVEFLGNPATSPYGNPIPGAQEPAQDPTSSRLKSLAEAGEEEVVIERISEQLQGDAAVMRQLDAGGVGAGIRVRVQHRDGRVVLAHDDVQVELDDAAARLVYVSTA